MVKSIKFKILFISLLTVDLLKIGDMMSKL